MWDILDHIDQIEEIKSKSFDHPIAIFKHSTRCSISLTAKTRLERSVPPEEVQFYYLDLIAYRAISNELERVFEVEHESPQLLLIQNGVCVYHESHLGIHMDEIGLHLQA
jgi:bacillithiol system protein YtxJ